MSGLEFKLALSGRPAGLRRCEQAVRSLRRRLPGVRFVTLVRVRRGVRDPVAALLGGAVDGAVHGNVAIEDSLPAGIDWFRLRSARGGRGCTLLFRGGDARFLRLRSLFVKPVVFAGAGTGAATCTLGAMEALERCDVCLHDRLVDVSLLDRLPPGAGRMDAGKRCGARSMAQEEIDARVATAARRGLRVVRLKGGDPGIFGRLAEEIAALDALRLPYRVIPGVSSLHAATTGTGMLLTRRGVSSGFVVMTPRQQGGGVASVCAGARAALPMVFFMGVGVLAATARRLVADGLPKTTPAAVALDAGTADETVIRGSLADIADRLPETWRAGLVIVGAAAASAYHPEWGALMGRRVLLPDAETPRGAAADAVRDYGGFPVALPLFRAVPRPAGVSILKTLPEFDWLFIPSPAAARLLMRLLPAAGLDTRALPRILAADPDTDEACRRHGVAPDVTPRGASGPDAIARAARRCIAPGASVLRLASEQESAEMTRRLVGAGFRARECILYSAEPLRPKRAPAFDAVFFPTAAAVEAFPAIGQPATLAGKTVVAADRATVAALAARGIRATRTTTPATAGSAIQTLAAAMVREALLALPRHTAPTRARARRRRA